MFHCIEKEAHIGKEENLEHHKSLSTYCSNLVSLMLISFPSSKLVATPSGSFC
jgi:hypothetical protein